MESGEIEDEVEPASDTPVDVDDFEHEEANEIVDAVVDDEIEAPMESGEIEDIEDDVEPVSDNNIEQEKTDERIDAVVEDDIEAPVESGEIEDIKDGTNKCGYTKKESSNSIHF